MQGADKCAHFDQPQLLQPYLIDLYDLPLCLMLVFFVEFLRLSFP